MDYRVSIKARFERRTLWYWFPRFPQYGVTRFFRLGYWGVRLWEVR